VPYTEPARPLGGTTFLFAVTCGVAVSSIYLPQALLPLIATDLRTGTAGAGLVVTLTQLGYATGIALLCPLGDLVRPRRLLPTLLWGMAICLVGATVAPTLLILATAATLVGLFAVLPQLLVPLVARLAPTGQAAHAVGALTTGLVGGIFGGRILSSLIAELTGWRGAYLTVAASAVVLAVLLRPWLPAESAASDSMARNPAAAYVRLMASLPGLIRRQPVLRQACLFQFCGFALFSAVWTTLVLHLTGPWFGWSTATAGLFGLVGLVAGSAGPVIGRVVDRHGYRGVTTGALSIIAAAIGILTLAGGALIGLVVGMFSLSLGLQATQIVQQTRVLADRPDARSRVNTLFMTTVFLGGSFGSAVGITVFTHHGWLGVCGFGAAMLAMMLAVEGYARRLAKQTVPSSPASKAAS